DTERFFVICVNSLGSCFGSTGAASIDPATGKRYRLSFPVLTLQDVARGGQAVLEHLGIDTLCAVVGNSMGGMSALGFCAMYPSVARTLVSISSCTSALPFAIAVRSLQREMIMRDPLWMEGNYDPARPPVVGQRLARKLGMMTYRSAREWEERFGRQLMRPDSLADNPFYGDFAVESYLEAAANKFTGQFDANCYLYLSRASDLFDLCEHGGSLDAAYAMLNLDRALVIGVTSDILFPLHQQKSLADGLSTVVDEVKYAPLDCIMGHDSFLVDMPAFQPVIAGFLRKSWKKLRTH
ncbi:MAG: alpha/beta fold hydrolase, partial [Gammaproteobacteria bacterium]|nr:alpha/beta fold hydrolase [Gammaproteobacteria bacterium]